jgi:hypothetical protein
LVWLALSRSNDNLVYVAQNQKTNAIAVSIRGTLASNLDDLVEDLDVGTVVGFQVNDSAQTVGVSAGAMMAFSEVMNAICPQSPILKYLGTNLMTVLQALVLNASSPPVVYVTGHSLGGAIATMVGLYLQAQTWDGASAPSFQVYTFAAPTAGVKSFADAFQAAFTGTGPNSAVQIVNPWDVVPRAWSELQDVVSDFFPSPGPKMDEVTTLMYGMVMGLTNGQTYVQACAEQTSCTSTSDYLDYLSSATDSSTQNFQLQSGYQHNVDLYRRDLGAAPLWPSSVPTNAPIATKIDKACGSTSGGDVVNIYGNNFTSDCVVDFGTVAAAKVQYQSASHIQVTTPPGYGLVNITVTNSLGTSATTPAAAYAFGGPEPINGQLSPTSGTSDTSLKLTGWGLQKATSVVFLFTGAFGALTLVPASNFNVISDKEIDFTPPTLKNGMTAPLTINVAITVGDLFAPCGSFKYTS